MLEYIMILEVDNSTRLVCVHANNEGEAYCKIGKWCIDNTLFPETIRCYEVKGSIEEIA